VELIYADKNFRFNMSVVFMTNYYFSGMYRLCESQDKPVYFDGAHRDRDRGRVC
jgi:hypothetical protein